jgi:2-phospho-L-lactate guanylyltransferase
MRPPGDEVWAVVPVKRLSAAKSRLRDALGPATRIALSRAMLEDVLGALGAASGLAGIRLVSADPEVAAIGRRHGAQTVMDREEAGTSAAATQGIAALPEGWGGVVILPADIPFVTAQEIERVLAALPLHGVVLAPAIRDGGTNLLAMRSAARIPLCFGEASFERHRAAAVEPAVMVLAGAGRDIDVEADLHAVTPRDAVTATTRLLRDLFSSDASCDDKDFPAL